VIRTPKSERRCIECGAPTTSKTCRDCYLRKGYATVTRYARERSTKNPFEACVPPSEARRNTARLMVKSRAFFGNEAMAELFVFGGGP
jgi:hypothetical protein